MAKAGTVFINTRLGTSQLSADIAKAQRTLRKAGRDFQAIGTTFTKAVSLPIAAIGTLAVKSFADFDDAMTKSLAIMGKVSGSMKKDMVDAAKSVSTQTTFSSKQAAESYFYLASAGLDAAKSIEALPTVAKFAQAGAFDMAQATDLLTDAQSALGLSSQELIRVSDVLVKANTLANASVEQFSQSLTTQAAAALKTVNKDIEEGVAVLAAFADQGLKGADAGTKFSIVMRDLQTKAIDNKSAFEELGIKVFDSTGKMQNLGGIIGNLEDALAGMSDETKKATLLQLGFTDKSVSAIQSLLGTSQKIKTYEDALRSAGGTTEEVANKQLGSLISQLKLIGNELQNSFITIGDTINSSSGGGVLDIARGFSQALKDMADGFASLSPKIQSFIVTFAALSAAIGPVLIAFGALAGALGAKLIFTVGAISTAIAGLTTLFVTFRKEFSAGLDILSSSLETGLNVINTYAEAFLKQIGRAKGWSSAINEAKQAVGGLIEAQQKNKEITEKQVEAVKKWFKELGGFEGAKKQVKGFLSQFIDLDKASEKVSESITKIRDIFSKNKPSSLPKASKESQDALKELTKELERTKYEIEGQQIDKAIEQALKKGNETDLNIWLERLKVHTEKGVLEGAKDALAKAGEAGKAIVAEQARLESDLKIDEIRGRQQEALKAQHEEAVNSWASLMEDAISGSRFNFEDQFKKAAVRIAATFLASLNFNDISGSFAGAIRAAGGAITPGNLGALGSLGSLFGGASSGAPAVPQVVSIGGAPPVPATANGFLGGVSSTGIAAGAYVGYRQFQGAQNYFEGEKLSLEERLALAIPTFGTSLFANAFNPFGSGKSGEEKIRDQIREALRQTGLGESLSFAGVGGNYSFAEERDVGPGQTSAFKDQLMAFAEPFAQLLGGGGKTDFASILANAAGGALGPVDNLTEALFNLTSILDTAGLSAQKAKDDLTAAFLAGDITAGQFGERLQNLNLIANDSFGNIQDRVNILANEMSENGPPQTQLRALESAFRHASTTGQNQFEAVRAAIVERFEPDSAAAFNELRNIGIESFESFASLSADQIFALFDIINRFSNGVAKSLEAGSSQGASAVIKNLQDIEREASRVNSLLNDFGSRSDTRPSTPQNIVTTIPNTKSTVYNIDARGASAGVEHHIIAAIKQAENRAVVRSVSAMEQRGRRL